MMCWWSLSNSSQFFKLEGILKDLIGKFKWKQLKLQLIQTTQQRKSQQKLFSSLNGVENSQNWARTTQYNLENSLG